MLFRLDQRIWWPKLSCKLPLVMLIMLASQHVFAVNSYTLDDLLRLAIEENPSLRVVSAQREAAVAGVQTARAYLNPELELNAGPANYRASGPQPRNGTYNVTLSQPLEFGSVRSARRELAEQGITIVDKSMTSVQFDLTNQVKIAYMLVLQKQQVAALMKDNFELLKQIQTKVKLKVDTGEAPKYELIKSDTELLAAERDYQMASTDVEAAKASLRGLIGQAVPSQFEISSAMPEVKTPPSLDELLAMLQDNPTLQQLKAIEQTADAKVKLEEQLRFSGVTLKSGFEQDPDLNIFRVGIVVPLPLWNKREGPIAEAMANVVQAKANSDFQRLSFQRELETAYQRYLIAKNQLSIFESGLLSQSEAALVRAESAYKFGERGILEYLDAQRTYRSVRRDYVTSKFDYLISLLQIEKLVGKHIILPIQQG